MSRYGLTEPIHPKNGARLVNYVRFCKTNSKDQYAHDDTIHRAFFDFMMMMSREEIIKILSMSDKKFSDLLIQGCEGWDKQ